jgi:prepilin-type N-terminal cleavage/methylation domain-containing protein
MTISGRQCGFTLVEVAVVLVIAGLIFGSVLKNQELIAGAKAKRLASDFAAIAIAVHTYKDIHRSLPGDDRAAASHLPGAAQATTPAGQIGNSRIDGAWNSLLATDESYLAWQHLRLARLLGGIVEVPPAPAAGDAYNPRNGADGRLGITSDPVLTTGSWPAMLFACMSGLDGSMAVRLDRLVDDGMTSTGNLRVICAGECASGPGATVPVAGDSGTYTVCAAL